MCEGVWNSVEGQIACDGTWDDGRRPFARFLPTSSFVPPRDDHRDWLPSNVRHGCVLIRHMEQEHWVFAVWNPITNQLVELPKLPDSLGNRSQKAAVLCAATGACDHLDCHSGPFTVVSVGTNNDLEEVDVEKDYIGEVDEFEADDILRGGFRRVPKDMFTCVYSSESSAWSEPDYDEYSDDDLGWESCLLVGNVLYFVLRQYDYILQYDLGTREIPKISLPYKHFERIYSVFARIKLTTMKDGQLGFARVEGSQLCLWSRDGDNGGAGWKLCKVVDLKKLFPLVDSIFLMNCLVGFVEGICVAFVEVNRELFTVDMKSGLKKVAEDCCMGYAFPYINFCTPALGAPSRDDAPRVSTSSASIAKGR